MTTVSEDVVVGEERRRGAATKGRGPSSLGDLAEEELVGVGVHLGEPMEELRIGLQVFSLGALHPSTYRAQGLPMAIRLRDQTRDTPR